MSVLERQDADETENVKRISKFVATLFANHPDLLQDFLYFLPYGHRRPPPVAAVAPSRAAPPRPDDAQKAKAPADGTYSRRDKSLGALCESFMGIYGSGAHEVVNLNQAAESLGVEKRRMYDIMNVLESLGMVKRRAKNAYDWRGMGCLAASLDGLRGSPMLRSGEITGTAPAAASAVDAKTNERKKKSLGIMTRSFVSLFLEGSDTISLPDSVSRLLGATKDQDFNSRMRRLYDITNILCSFKIVEKIRMPGGKRGFRWCAPGTDISAPGRKRPADASLGAAAKRR